MKKKIIAFILVLLSLTVFMPSVLALGSNDVSASAAVLYSPDLDEVIFAKNEHLRLPMASTTKIMTALLAIEEATPDLNIIVSEPMVKVEGSSMGLLPGDSVTLKTLAYGMMLESGNDAANVTAHVIGNSLPGFAKLMNKKAKEIGMKNTNFVTPSGLDAPDHYSTAHDMALLAAYALKNPEFASISSLKSVRVEYGNPPYLRTLSNHNRLLHSYSGCVGIKTGFTKKSGRCLVSAAVRDGKTLIVVTLKASNDWNDHQKLLDYGFDKLETIDLPKRQGLTLSVVNGVTDTVCVDYLHEPKAFFINPPKNIESHVFLKPFEYAPIYKNQVLGRVVYKQGDRVLADVPLLACEDVLVLETAETPKIRLKERLINRLKDVFNR